MRAGAEAEATKAAAVVNETEAFGRRVSFEKQQSETEFTKKRRQRDEAEELGEIIQRFAELPPTERELRRFDFSAQIAAIIPGKRTREHFVSKLVKAPGAVAAEEPASKKGVYVLRLEDSTYYVGKSTDIEARILQHKSGNGASFTASLGETAVSVALMTRGSIEDLEAWERAETLERMYKHGIRNVRGWMFVTPVLSTEQQELAFQQICARKELCSICGRHTHFAAQCFANGRVAWAI